MGVDWHLPGARLGWHLREVPNNVVGHNISFIVENYDLDDSV